MTVYLALLILVFPAAVLILLLAALAWLCSAHREIRSIHATELRLQADLARIRDLVDGIDKLCRVVDSPRPPSRTPTPIKRGV